jgi:hypothetical protein
MYENKLLRFRSRPKASAKMMKGEGSVVLSQACFAPWSKAFDTSGNFNSFAPVGESGFPWYPCSQGREGSGRRISRDSCLPLAVESCRQTESYLET